MKNIIKTSLFAFVALSMIATSLNVASANGKETATAVQGNVAGPAKHPHMMGRDPMAAMQAAHSGISQSSQSPYAHLYTITNQYHGITAGSHIDVYAGSLRTNPSQGVFVVTVVPLSGAAPQTRVIMTAKNAGPAQIVLNNAGTLVMATANGNRFNYTLPFVGHRLNRHESYQH